MADRMRVGVLASGGGSNFQSLVDRLNGSGEDGRYASAEVVGVIASRETAGVVDRARVAGVASAVLPGPTAADRGAEFLLETLDAWRCDIIALAGYMKLVPEPVVRRHWGRIVNIHPALLPAFGGHGMYGARVHAAVIAAGVRITGATVHFVDEAYDRGPIICQWPVPVLASDSPDSVAARVLAVEHELLPAAVEALARGHVRLEPDGRIRWTREWFESEAFTNREG